MKTVLPHLRFFLPLAQPFIEKIIEKDLDSGNFLR